MSQQSQQPYNPANFTNQLGQKAAEFTAAQLERMGMGGKGFIGETQNKLIGQQVGAYVANGVNEVFHIQNTQGSGPAKPQSGVRNFISNEVGQIFHGKKEEEAPPQNPEAFMDEAKNFVVYQAKQVFHSSGGNGKPTEVQRVTQVTKTVGTDGGHPGSHIPTEFKQVTQVTKTVTNDSGHPGSHMPADYQQMTQYEPQYEQRETQNFNNNGGPGSHIPSGVQTGPYDNQPSGYGYQQQQQQNYGYPQQQPYENQQQQNYGYPQQQPYGYEQQPYGTQQQPSGYQQQPSGYSQQPGDEEEGGFFEKTTNKVKGYFNKD
jgi:hypothetical protein